MYLLPNVLNRWIVKLWQNVKRQMFVAERAVMQLLAILVVLGFSVGLILYALPIILYLAPLIVIGLLISCLTDSARHHAKTDRH